MLYIINVHLPSKQNKSTIYSCINGKNIDFSIPCIIRIYIGPIGIYACLILYIYIYIYMYIYICIYVPPQLDMVSNQPLATSTQHQHHPRRRFTQLTKLTPTLRRTRLVGTARWRFVRSHGMLHLFIFIYIYRYRYIPPIGLQPSLAQILGGSTRVGRSSRWRFVRSAAKASFCLFLVRLNRSLREFLRRKWWLDGWLEVFGVDGSRNKEAKQRETFKERSPRDGWMEMWFFEEDFEMGELFVDVVLEVFCDLWTLFLGHEKTLKFCGSMLWAKIKGATLVLVSWT